MRIKQWLIFLVIGIILFAVGASVLVGGFIAIGNAAEAEAIIIDISDSGEKTAYVSYHYEGNTYHNVKTGFYSSDMRVGDKLKIYVNKTEPAEIVNTLFFFIFGGVFAFVGLVFIIVGIALKKSGALPMYYRSPLKTYAISLHYAFSRHIAQNFLEIRQYYCENFGQSYN